MKSARAWVQIAKQYEECREEARAQGDKPGHIEIMIAGEWYRVSGSWVSREVLDDAEMIFFDSGIWNITADVDAVQAMRWNNV